MGIKFDPSEADSNVPAGQYDISIEGCEIRRGKTSGTQYAALSLRVYGPDREVEINDNVMLEGRGTFRLKNLMLACGLRQQFEAGNFEPNDVIGKSLSAELEVEQSDQYGDQNRVKKYHPGTSVGRKASAPVKRPAQSQKADIAADDIPF